MERRLWFASSSVSLSYFDGKKMWTLKKIVAFFCTKICIRMVLGRRAFFKWNFFKFLGTIWLIRTKNFSSVLANYGLEDAQKWCCVDGGIADMPPSTVLGLSARDCCFGGSFYLQRHFGFGLSWKCDKSTLLGARCGCGCVCTTISTGFLYLTWWPPVEPGKARRGWLQQTPGYFCSGACGDLGPCRGCGAALVPLQQAWGAGSPRALCGNKAWIKRALDPPRFL